MRLLTISWLVLLSMAAGLRAQTTNTTNGLVRPISLEECFELAVKFNFDVQISRVNRVIADYALSAAYGDWDPALSASGSHSFNSSPSGAFDVRGLPIPPAKSDSDSLAANLGPGATVGGLLPSGLTYNLTGSASDTVFTQAGLTHESSIGAINMALRQPLLKNFWTDNTRTTIKVNKNRVKYSEYGVQAQIMDVVNKVAQAYYDLISAREKIKVQHAGLELAERLVGENKKRVQVGTMAPLDEKQAESQAEGKKADLLAAQNDYSASQNVIKGLMIENYIGIQPTELDPTDPLTDQLPLLNLQASWSRGMTIRPDLQQARLDVERQNIVIRYNYNQLFPQLDLFGSYGFNGAAQEFSGVFGQIGSGSDPRYSFGASVSFPLGNRSARGTYQGSKETKKLFLLNLKVLEKNILIRIDNAVKTVRNAYQQVLARRQARIYALAALEAGQKKLESGKSTSFEVLTLQRDLTDSRSQEIDALRDFSKALSQLYFEEGSILERNHLGVEVK